MNEPAPQPNAPLADAIEESGLRKGFIAKQIGVHQSELSHWLRGRRHPDKVQREKLALLLRRRPDDFLPSDSVVATHHADPVGHAPELCTLPDRADAERREAA